MKLAVVGLGLIGGSLAKDLRRTKFTSQIVGVDSNREHALRAKELGIVDDIMTLEYACEWADLVVLATPVNKIIELLPLVLDLISENTTVIDMGSTKRTICDSVNFHSSRSNFVPVHPMSGTENSGPDAAIDNLFNEKIAIVCDQQKSRPQHLALVEKMLQTIGMSVAYMSAEEQDRSTAYISHLPHVVSFALANAVLSEEDGKIIFDLASGGFRSTSRLAKSSPEMWGPIFEQNKDYMAEALDLYIEHLTQFRDSLLKEDCSSMMELMKNANKIRGVLDKSETQLIKDEKRIIKLYTK